MKRFLFVDSVFSGVFHFFDLNEYLAFERGFSVAIERYASRVSFKFWDPEDPDLDVIESQSEVEKARRKT